MQTHLGHRNKRSVFYRKKPVGTFGERQTRQHEVHLNFVKTPIPSCINFHDLGRHHGGKTLTGDTVMIAMMMPRIDTGRLERITKLVVLMPCGLMKVMIVFHTNARRLARGVLFLMFIRGNFDTAVSMNTRQRVHDHCRYKQKSGHQRKHAHANAKTCPVKLKIITQQFYLGQREKSREMY